MYKLCTPAMVYVVLAGISILIALFSKFHAFSILTKIVFVGAWTWFLNYLCMKGYKAISWFLVLLPFLLMLGIFALAAEIVNVASKQILPPSYHREGMGKIPIGEGMMRNRRVVEDMRKNREAQNNRGRTLNMTKVVELGNAAGFDIDNRGFSGTVGQVDWDGPVNEGVVGGDAINGITLGGDGKLRGIFLDDKPTDGRLAAYNPKYLPYL